MNLSNTTKKFAKSIKLSLSQKKMELWRNEIIPFLIYKLEFTSQIDQSIFMSRITSVLISPKIY